MICFRPRGAPGPFWAPPGKAPGAQVAPKRVPEASGSELGAIRKPPGGIKKTTFEEFSMLFGAFWLPLAMLSVAFAGGAPPPTGVGVLDGWPGDSGSSLPDSSFRIPLSSPSYILPRRLRIPPGRPHLDHLWRTFCVLGRKKIAFQEAFKE